MARVVVAFLPPPSFQGVRKNRRIFFERGRGGSARKARRDLRKGGGRKGGDKGKYLHSGAKRARFFLFKQ